MRVALEAASLGLSSGGLARYTSELSLALARCFPNWRTRRSLPGPQRGAHRQFALHFQQAREHHVGDTRAGHQQDELTPAAGRERWCWLDE